MVKTIESLMKAMIAGKVAALSNAVEFDYFGRHNINNNNTYDIIFKVYSVLVNHLNVSAELLENCFKTNRLDVLIHAKFVGIENADYAMFCKMGIVIGDTYFTFGKDSLKVEPMKI